MASGEAGPECEKGPSPPKCHRAAHREDGAVPRGPLEYAVWEPPQSSLSHGDGKAMPSVTSHAEAKDTDCALQGDTYFINIYISWDLLLDASAKTM